MRRSVLIGVMFVLLSQAALAHPGPLDACGGHIAEEWVDYPTMASGEIPVPSELGEYHLHFTSRQMNEEVLPSLALYRQLHPVETFLGTDYGSFVAGGTTYHILEYTRQQEAIIQCGEDVFATGIARIRK